MPEAIGIEENLISLNTHEKCSMFNQKDVKCAEDELGFRITGGSDFFMPITIFHVISHSQYVEH